MGNNSYDVGFGKPPKHSRFRKGISGNPNGRPKGKRNFITILTKVLNETIVIEENGVRRSVTKLEAALSKLANQAVSGDAGALKLLSTLARSVAERADEPAERELTVDDLKIVQRFLQREGRSRGGGNET